jgi:hypothetical protein
MEKQILNILNFDLYSPTAVGFIKLYNQILMVNKKALTCALYLSDLMLLATSSHIYPPSLLGSACLFVSLIATGFSIDVS